jgi:hypothetical protein
VDIDRKQLPGRDIKLWTPIAVGITVLALTAASCGDATADTTTPPTTTPTATTLAATTTTPPTIVPQTTIATTTTQPPATTTTAAPVEETVTGVVIAVEGNLAGIDSFVIRLPDGSDLALAPTEGLLFDGAGPLSHVRDHLVSGNPVTVTYVDASEGLPTVHAIGDASGDTHSDH